MDEEETEEQKEINRKLDKSFLKNYNDNRYGLY